MADIDSAQVLAFIDSHEDFIVVGHKEPDGDCVCSQLALASFLERRGKRVICCSAGPFKRGEVMPYAPRFSAEIPGDRPLAAVIVVDCSELSRVGSLEKSLEGRPLAFIDHHSAGDAHGDALYVDPSAPSVTFLIQRLISEAGDTMTGQEAELLLLGLCTDTGFFRHLGAGSARVFDSASAMASAGASPMVAHRAMYSGKSPGSRILLGLILSRLQAYYDGRLYYSYETLEDTKTYGLEGRDSDSLFLLIQSIDGCQAAFVVRQETEDNCTVGFRSRDPVDVSRVAQVFGGGGHKQAAGLSIRGTIPDVRDRLLSAFAQVFPPPGN